MKVELLSYASLGVVDIAICKCYGNKPHIEEEKIQGRINRIANVNKHSSTIEHLSYTFDIDGISRACLQELVRHRIASYTVKSSRYTLQELARDRDIVILRTDISWDLVEKYCVLTGDVDVDFSTAKALFNLQSMLINGIPNDKAKYCMPEAYKTSLVMTINARSLQNFLNLRTDSHALWEIQNLAREMYKVLPGNHKFLYEKLIKEEEK